MSPLPDKITFAPGRLCPEPMVFPILFQNAEVLAIAKLPGLATDSDPWQESWPNLTAALLREWRQGKPQLLDLDLEGIYPLWSLDPEVSGLYALAKQKVARDAWKNAIGSAQVIFRYRFVSLSSGPAPALACDLPLARHKAKARMLFSHTTGKKTQTRFRLLERYGRALLWEGETTDHRPHQIRAHAAECGIPVLGEATYSRQPIPLLSELKRSYRAGRREERLLYEGVCLHLAEVEWKPAEEGQSLLLTAPFPRRLEVLLKHFREHSS